MSVLSLFVSVNRRNSQQVSNNTIFKEGWIFKKSCISTQYKKHWMVLKGTKLTCHSSQNTAPDDNHHSTQTFNLSLYRFKVERHSKSLSKFFLINQSVTNGSNHVTFKTLTTADCDEWVFKIQEAIISGKLSKYRGQAPLYSTFESAFEDNESGDDSDPNECDDSKTTNSSFDGFRIRSITISSTAHYPYHFSALAVGPDERASDDSDDDDDNNDNEQNMDKSGINTQGIKILMLQPDATLKGHQRRNSKIQFIEKEIIKTEETYFHGIRTLLNEILIPMFENQLVDESKYFKQITSSMPNLVAFHELFLEQLKDAYSYSHDTIFEDDADEEEEKVNALNSPVPERDTYKSIAQVFNAQNKEEFVQIYIKYISDYKTILDLFGDTFRDNEPLQTYLRNKRKDMKPLSNYLILPVQRVPRYVLLLKDLKANTNSLYPDYHEIDCALKLVEEIAMEINERKRKIENLSQCLQIQQSLTNLTETIVDHRRHFVGQFVFIKKENKRQRQFFVFSDMIIIANKKWSVKEIIKNLRTVHVDLKDENKNVFNLVTAENTCLYLAQGANDVQEFQHIVEQNRLQLLDYDVAHMKGVGSVSSIRKKIKKQRLSNSTSFAIKRSENLKLFACTRSAYKEYVKQKGKAPINTQLFLRYCKNKKHIKSAVYSVCDQIIKEAQQNNNM